MQEKGGYSAVSGSSSRKVWKMVSTCISKDRFLRQHAAAHCHRLAGISFRWLGSFITPCRRDTGASDAHKGTTRLTISRVIEGLL